MNDDDFLTFKEEDEAEVSLGSELSDYWHLLIVDDDNSVLAVTQLVLKNIEVLGKALKLHTATSAAQAKELLQKDIPFAMALIDVVMETDQAGLDLVHWIRNEHNNQHIRLVLRTGQPGQAPEKEVITNYDINDYREKTELTANKLYTLTCVCLRGYRDIIALYENKKGLETIIKSSNKIFAHQSLDDFTRGILQQLCALFHIDTGSVYSNVNFIAASYGENSSKIIAATGRFNAYLNHSLDDVIEQVGDKSLKELCNQVGQHFGDNYFIGVYESHLGGKNLFFIEGIDKINTLDRQLIEIFGTNIGVAFDNQALYEEVEITQREMIYRMSEAVESRSKETSNHVKRVALTCQFLAKALGLSDNEIEIIYKASPLHDIGKIAIPDHILNKPGKLNAEEWIKMQSHAQIGYDILSSSELTVLRAGATIAGEHHENWDGSGYPNGKKAEEIHIYGRITAIADVFDALVNKRCYKQAWNIEDTMDFITEMSGIKFDPALVELVIKCKDYLMVIQNEYSD
ncbi:MAG: DUF3369 domain-containing protein [Saccharospirillaceae bacterium]|nr:DUF3369 domain-containing protein [Pseudomonadales bacterium]NRB80045.1 DUF3369 domain-containing protein [Saccharospirillaceae bacterium]